MSANHPPLEPKEKKNHAEFNVILKQLEKMDESFLKMVEILPGISKMYTSISNLSKEVNHALEWNEEQQRMLNLMQQKGMEQVSFYNNRMNELHQFHAEQQQETITLLGSILTEAVSKKETHIQRHEVDEPVMQVLEKISKAILEREDSQPSSVELPKQPGTNELVSAFLEGVIIDDMAHEEVWRNLPLFLQNILMKLDREDIDDFLGSFFESKVLKSKQGQEWLDGFCLFLEALQHNASTPDHPFEENEQE